MKRTPIAERLVAVADKWKIYGEIIHILCGCGREFHGATVEDSAKAKTAFKRHRCAWQRGEERLDVISIDPMHGRAGIWVGPGAKRRNRQQGTTGD